MHLYLPMRNEFDNVNQSSLIIYTKIIDNFFFYNSRRNFTGMNVICQFVISLYIKI